MTKELAPIERARAALKACATETALTELAAKSRDITAITNADGYQQVHGARMALKAMRVTIEKTGKAAREDATAFSKAVIAEEKRLIAIIEPEETRLSDLQCSWDAAREAERRAKAEAERERVQAILSRIAKLQSLPEVYTSALPPQRIAEVIAQIEGGLSADYGEYAAQAEALRQAALVALRRAHVDAIEREDRDRAAEAERQAKAAQAAKEAAEREAAVKAAREAEEARLKAEREQFEAEQARTRRQVEIQQRIQALRGPTHLTATDSPELIEQALRTVTGAPVPEADYGEFHAAATQAKRDGMERLSALLEAAQAHKAEQQRMADARAELERQQREQAERQAEIERKERQAKEAEEVRQAALKAELDRKAAEAARDREEQARRQQLRERVSSLTAAEIAAIVARELGVSMSDVANRLATIEHSAWLALAVSEDQNEEVGA